VENIDQTKHMLNRVNRMTSLAKRINNRHNMLFSKSGGTPGFSFFSFLGRNRNLVSRKAKNLISWSSEPGQIQPLRQTIFPLDVSQEQTPLTWQPLEFIHHSSNVQPFKTEYPRDAESESLIQSVLAEKQSSEIFSSELSRRPSSPVPGLANHPPFTGRLYGASPDTQISRHLETENTSIQNHPESKTKLPSGIIRKPLTGITFQKSEPQVDIQKRPEEPLNSGKESLKNIQPLTLKNQTVVTDPQIKADQLPVKTTHEETPVLSKKLDNLDQKAELRIVNQKLPPRSESLEKLINEPKPAVKSRKDKTLSLHRKTNLKNKNTDPGLRVKKTNSFSDTVKDSAKYHVHVKPGIKYIVSSPDIKAKTNERQDNKLKVDEQVITENNSQSMIVKNVHRELPEIKAQTENRLFEEDFKFSFDKKESDEFQRTSYKPDLVNKRENGIKTNFHPVSGILREIDDTISKNIYKTPSFPTIGLKPLISQNISPLIPTTFLKTDRKPADKGKFFSPINDSSLSSTKSAEISRKEKIQEPGPGISENIFPPEISPGFQSQDLFSQQPEQKNEGQVDVNYENSYLVKPESNEIQYKRNILSKQPISTRSFAPLQVVNNSAKNRILKRKESSDLLPQVESQKSFDLKESDLNQEIEHLDRPQSSKNEQTQDNLIQEEYLNNPDLPVQKSGHKFEFPSSTEKVIPDIIRIWSNRDTKPESMGSRHPAEQVDINLFRRPVEGDNIQLKQADSSTHNASQMTSTENNILSTGMGLPAEENPQDIDELARKVYGIIKKRLARDRERSAGLN
jgi:hypothetical protein